MIGDEKTICTLQIGEADLSTAGSSTMLPVVAARHRMLMPSPTPVEVVWGGCPSQAPSLGRSSCS